MQIESQSVSLAEKLRPRSLQEIYGQTRVLSGADNLLQRIQGGQLTSLIIWGPPGTGKTSAALCLAQAVGAEFINVQATDLTTQKIRDLIEDSIQRKNFGQRTLLFVDEIHRLTKVQQDGFLSALEKGQVYLIGATTENPHFELNRALLSRCHLIRFEALQKVDFQKIYQKCLLELGAQKDFLAADSLENLIEVSFGDARKFLNLVELCYQFFITHREVIQIEQLAEILSTQALTRTADRSYKSDLISAFIKSVRGSDPDAAILYLAQALELGEDPTYLARRLVILASEDIGNADPRALTLAVSAFQAVELIGMPEARIPLSQVAIYLATAPKSNSSYQAINAALDYVRKKSLIQIPSILKSSIYDLSSEDKKYISPHLTVRGWNEQSYKTKEHSKVKFYEPILRGFEKSMAEYLKWIRGESK